VRYERRFPATINTPEAARRVRGVAGALPNLNVLDVAPSMSSEDFAFMLQAVPGCYLWLGGGEAGGKTPGLHSSRYDFNDELVPIGVQLWASLVKESLAAPR
jgi:metal-dependent amidase/aminoacylase/carboxypeptidase family protein